MKAEHNAPKRARELIHDHEVVRLRGEAAERFVSLLLTPPEPNAKLREAAIRHASSLHLAVRRAT